MQYNQIMELENTTNKENTTKQLVDNQIQAPLAPSKEVITTKPEGPALAGLEIPDDQFEQFDPFKEVEIIVHRAGFSRPETAEDGSTIEENTIPRAIETLPLSDGCEIDLQFTSEGVGVVTHDRIGKLTFAEFKEQYPNHATLESWVNWFKTDQLSEKNFILTSKAKKKILTN
ncbi:hypothetical protein GF362_04200 [Candidatus Dojkabacteria bacterium]|nr:hypothetical protein [Candidatus Dojkabacteria bacterium]